LTKELSLLRKKLDAEQDSYRAAVTAWESSQNQLRAQVEQLRGCDLAAQTR
jgi:hypothetical protein